MPNENWIALVSPPSPLLNHGCQMDIARFLDRMCLAFGPSGFGLLDYGSATLRCKIVFLLILGLRQGGGRGGRNFAIWQPCPQRQCNVRMSCKAAKVNDPSTLQVIPRPWLSRSVRAATARLVYFSFWEILTHCNRRNHKHCIFHLSQSQRQDSEFRKRASYPTLSLTKSQETVYLFCETISSPFII